MSTANQLYAPWKPPFRYNVDGQWIEDSQGQRLLDVRGWGFLTSKGACNLDEQVAARIQDTIGAHVTELMNADAPMDADAKICYQCGAVLNDSFWKVLRKSEPMEVCLCDFRCLSRWVASYS